MNTLIRRSFWCFLFLALLWLGGMQWFALRIPAAPAPPGEKADAIVVLTGGRNRLEYGLQLLAEGRANRLFISGVHEKITQEQLVSLMPENLRQQMVRLDDGAVTLGREAWNTIGNAEETRRWLSDRHVKRILLVTSNYHMPRSYYEFRHLVKGVEIIPAPVPAEDYDALLWWATSRYRLLVFLEFHKYLAGMLRHALIPAIRE